jgi:hypothetical protein
MAYGFIGHSFFDHALIATDKMINCKISVNGIAAYECYRIF